jgi:hypothetical protein
MPVYSNPDFARLPQPLAAIFDEAADGGFFSLPGWYDVMARHGVSAGSEIRVYSDERPESATALVLRTMPGDRRRLSSLADIYSPEHAMLAPPGSDIAVGLAAILAEVQSERPAWQDLLLCALDPAAPAYAAAVRALRRAGFLVECVFQFGTWYEETEGLDFARYLAARPPELRNTWRRKRRRLERGHRLRSELVSSIGAVEQAIADYQAIYAQTWKPPEAYPGLVPALIRRAAELGALRLGLYYIDGEPAAAQLWTVWRGVAVIHKLAHDRRFDDLSLGTLLTMEMIERSLAEDRPREITLGLGDDPYKKLWLPRRRERWGIRASNTRSLRGLGYGIEREAAKLYHRLRGERTRPFG